MLDCGLDISSALHFLPLPIVQSKRLAGLSTYLPRDTPDPPQYDGVRQQPSYFILIGILM